MSVELVAECLDVGWRDAMGFGPKFGQREKREEWNEELNEIGRVIEIVEGPIGEEIRIEIDANEREKSEGKPEEKIERGEKDQLNRQFAHGFPFVRSFHFLHLFDHSKEQQGGEQRNEQRGK